jgi:hypothetical protein
VPGSAHGTPHGPVYIDYNDYVSKSEPVTIRLSPELDRWVTSESKRIHRSKGAVLESLAGEALKARLFPGIAFRGDDWDRRAWVVGTSFDVWEVVRAYQQLGSADAVAGGKSVSVRQVRLALVYYERFSDEIDAFIGRDRRSLEELRRDYPTIDVVEV